MVKTAYPSAFPRLTQYRSVTDGRTDGQTDRQTDMPPTAYTTLAKVALRCAAIKIIHKSSRVNFHRNKNQSRI